MYHGNPKLTSSFYNTLFRLRLQGIGYVQIRLGSDLLWHRSTVFTRDRFKTATVRFRMGSPS